MDGMIAIILDMTDYMVWITGYYFDQVSEPFQKLRLELESEKNASVNPYFCPPLLYREMARTFRNLTEESSETPESCSYDPEVISPYLSEPAARLHSSRARNVVRHESIARSADVASGTLSSNHLYCIFSLFILLLFFTVSPHFYLLTLVLLVLTLVFRHRLSLLFLSFFA